MRKKTLSLSLKILLVCASLGGVLFSCIFAVRDGYSHWGRRLLYFTAQSNIWIGLTALALLILTFAKWKKAELWLERTYLFRYIFTVSITVTGLVFCSVLAPFADESYHVWSFPSVMTHVLSPLLAVADLFVDGTPFPITRRHILLTALPPVFYFSVASVLEVFGVDFGRGVAYPYFFLNFRSPAGIFGFSATPPFLLGSFYWILLLSFIMMGISILYARLSPENRKRLST